MTNDNFIGDTEEILKDDSFFSKHSVVYLTKPENRNATQDDILENKIEAYFNQNSIDDDDLFETIFEECRSVCNNCAYYDADLNLDRMKEPWDKYKPTVKGNNFGRCIATPPTVVSITKNGKEALKTVNPITYPTNFCAMFLHRANDKRTVKDFK